MERVVETALARNRGAVDDLIASATRADGAEFGTGRWSASQHVVHVALAYRAFTTESRGGAPMALKGTARQRMVWRALGLGMVRLLGRLPRGARAPRELMPGEHVAIEESITMLHDAVGEFEQMVRETWTRRKTVRFNHPYFGAISFTQALRLVAVHTRHHAAALASRAR